MRDRIDFFISHSHVDKKWAEWIANILEKEGYSTFWGERDLKVGDNFVSIIQEYIEMADKLIAIFSPSYFSSTFCQAEVSAMLSKEKSNIIPVKISETQPMGDLSNLLYVDLYNVDEIEAKDRLLKAIKADKKKTFSNKSPFPGAQDTEKLHVIEAKFPGTLPINNLHFNNEEIILGGNEKVRAIKQAFDRNNTVSSTLTLSGLAGTGKTVIARNYIYQFGYLYNLIWWIDAHNDESILKAYNDFANENNLINDIDEIVNEERVVSVVKKWMQETDNWLFVFDDVIDFDVVQFYIPEKHQGNVLITSRDFLWEKSGASAITVDVFSTETAIKFLKLHGVSGTNEDLIKLSNTLGNIPFNLQMAAKYIVNNDLTVTDFLKQHNFWENNVNSASTYVNIASVYKEQGDYSNALKYYYKSLELLEKEQSSKCINVYNSIASVYQDLGYYDRAEELYNKILKISIEGLGNDSLDIDNIDVGITYNNLASILRHKKKYEEAISQYNNALTIFKENFHNEHPFIAATLSNLAVVYCEIGEYAHALNYYYEALSIRERVLGTNHPDTAKTCTSIAEIYDIQNEFEKSILFYEKALNIYNNALGTENPYIATVYTKIASIYQKQGDYQKALNYYNKALKMQHEPIGLNEFVSNSINVIGKDNNITNITNLSERSVSSDKSNEEIDKMTRKVLKELESVDKTDYSLFYNNFSEFQLIIGFIKKELIFETTGETEICHYSKLATLKHIIRVKDSQPQPRLRISNIAYLNDPSEGNVLLQLLKKSVKSNVFNMLFGKGNPDENKLIEVPFSKVFIGSFSTAKNKLPMWTLYGDDSKGCCLVFDDYFFDKKNELIESKSKADEKSVSPQELTLYRVKYVDMDTLNESDLIVGYLKKIASILDLFEGIISKYESVRIWIMALLDEIRFLFKDSDYDYENEVRIIIHADNAEIQVDDGQNELSIPKLYVDLQRKLIYKEIILGSKIDKPNAVAPFLLHSDMVKKVTRSGINYQ